MTRMYRNIATEFWTDSKVEQVSCNEKLLMLYLLTAPHGNLAGCFEVTFRRIEIETGIKPGQAERAMARLCELDMVSYSQETNEVLIRNWGKYNWSKSPKTKSALDKQIEHVKNPQLKVVLATEYEKQFGEPYPYPIDTVSTGIHTRRIPPVSVSVSVTDTDKGVGVQGEGETPKHRHGEFGNVLLTDLELDRLKERFPSDWQKRIDDLSYYIGSKDVKYKSHYRTILSWDRKNTATSAKGVGSGSYSEYD